MKVSMVTSTNSDPQRKTRSASETAPATAPPPARSTARSVENRPDASASVSPNTDMDAGLVSVLRFDAQARGAQTDVSPVEDAAAAARIVEWVRQSILGHPAQAMFAQANSNPESALRLLE